MNGRHDVLSVIGLAAVKCESRPRNASGLPKTTCAFPIGARPGPARALNCSQRTETAKMTGGRPPRRIAGRGHRGNSTWRILQSAVAWPKLFVVNLRRCAAGRRRHAPARASARFRIFGRRAWTYRVQWSAGSGVVSWSHSTCKSIGSRGPRRLAPMCGSARTRTPSERNDCLSDPREVMEKSRITSRTRVIHGLPITPASGRPEIA